MDAAEVTLAKRSLLAVPIVMLCVAGLLVAASGAGGAAPPSGWRYTMVAFSNTSAQDMDVFESVDGTQFEMVRPAAYRPPAGLVRDPSIFRNSDGLYYITYTNGGGASIGFARSSDRVNWTHMGDLPVPFCCALMPGTGDGTGSASPPGSSGSAGSADGPSLSPFTTKAWAPEWFVDGDRVNVILSMSTGGGFVPYLLTALEPSLRQWSLPVPLAGIGADHIDTTVVKVGSTYHAFTKNEATKVVEHAVAPSATGPYSFVPPGNWGTLVEGPTVVQLPNGVWRIYLDAYTEGKYLYSDSADGLVSWSPLREIPGLSGSVRHFGVMREPA
ncbi:glycoside hydrolase family 43 protein [Prescottella equi]|uniref:glycoside hydrolase family 43 protein n=1 Tax=Rhodococcus hoagii TaxID=43767 RepID=UPI000A117610|nr:glycoside hydrolase family 43 protein [Prescottella equi]ORL83665.1 arabinofuranosidase [Prescottella equi]